MIINKYLQLKILDKYYITRYFYRYPSIEDKRTGAIYLARKKEAWEKVCTAYNAVATSGVRSVEQLKISYDNKKQKARKALAEHNVGIACCVCLLL